MTKFFFKDFDKIDIDLGVIGKVLPLSRKFVCFSVILSFYEDNAIQLRREQLRNA